MKIIVYAEPLLVKTSGAPGRGMLQELIKLRPQDEFILVFRKGSEADPVKHSLESNLSRYNNWSIYIERRSRSKSNLLALFRFPGYCKLTPVGDLYLNMDCSSLGKSRPLVVTLADLSVMGKASHSSFQSGWQTGLRKFILSSGIRSADRIVTISNGSRHQLGKYFPADADKARLVYNGVDSTWFEKPPATPENLPGKRYLIWWGMISYRKNIDNLLKAYKTVCIRQGVEAVPDLVMVSGTQHLPADISNLLRDQVIHSKIKIIPFLSMIELQAFVEKSCGLVFPSRDEGFGMPAIEAMAMGKPVLTSSIPVMKEITNNLAIYCEPESEASIAKGIELLIMQTPADKNAQQIRKEWALQFSYHHAARGYSALIDELTSRK